jgi:hypothetical protein
MKALTRSLAAAVVMAAGQVFVLPANAQAPSPSPSPSDQSKSVSDQKLDAAAAALQQVVNLKADYQQRVESAPPSDRDRIAQEARNAMTKAVTDQGLSVEEYSSILTVAQNDPDVRQKILQRVNPPEK